MVLQSVPRLADRSKGRDNHFNLIRIIAATAVLVSHAYPIALGPQATEPLEHLMGFSLGALAVYIFFAISGFFITKSFDRGESRLRFVEARVLRLFPALIVVLVLTVLVAGLFLSTAPPGVFWRDAPGYLIRNLTLARLDYDLPGVFENTPYGPVINGSLWTLFYEVLCYMGVFVLGVLRAPRIFAGFVVLAGLACLILPHLALHRILTNLAVLGLPFLIGSAFYVWRHWIPLHWGLALACIPVVVLVHGTLAFQPVFVLAMTYWVFWLGLARVPFLLRYNRLGDYSYGVYIFAFPLQQLAASWGADSPGQNILWALPATLFCAVFLWHWVEKPALALVRSDRSGQNMLKRNVS